MAYPTEAQHQKNDAAAMKTHGAAAARWVKQIRANVDAYWINSISYEVFHANQGKLWDKIAEGGDALRLAVDFLLRQPTPVVFKMIPPFKDHAEDRAATAKAKAGGK